MDVKLIITQLDSSLNNDYKIKQEIPLDKRDCLIGKTENCQIKVEHELISREHAKLTYTSGGYYYIEDLDSTNGTLVNEPPLLERGERRQLRDGDMIALATKAIIFTFRFTDPYLTKKNTNINSPIRLTGLSVFPEEQEVYIDRQKVEPRLAPKEFALLELLVTEEGKVVSRDEIASHVWSDDIAGDIASGVSNEMIDKRVSETRKQLRRYSAHQYIKTVHGIGYQFVQLS